MPVETPSLFTQVIQDHLELKRRNATLEPAMPIDRYKHDDPFENHPLFKSEEQARLQETTDGVPRAAAPQRAIVLTWPAEAPAAPAEDPGLWSRSRDFDWGD